MSTYFISPPPLEDQVLDENGKFTSTFQNWLTSLYQGIETFLISQEGVQNGTSITVPILTPSSYTTTERNGISAPTEGNIIYNKSTTTLNSYLNGTWTTITTT